MTKYAQWIAAAVAILSLTGAPGAMAQVSADSTHAPPPPASTEPALKPSVITMPSWKKHPTGDQLNSAFPKRAWKENVEGRAQIRCIVNAEGVMTECKVVSETPEGYGFGEAALKLSRYFVMRPTTIDGVPVTGASVNIGIPFRLE